MGALKAALTCHAWPKRSLMLSFVSRSSPAIDLSAPTLYKAVARKTIRLFEGLPQSAQQLLPLKVPKR